MFPDFGTPIRDAADRFIEWLIVEHGEVFDRIARGILGVLVEVDSALRGAHPAVIIGGVGVIALLLTRRPVLSIAMMALTWGLGTLGLWDHAMQTVAIIAVAVAIAVVIGIPLGVLAARVRPVRAVLMPVLDLMQTIPSFVYLLPAAMLFGLGKVPAILATVVYAMPPLVRLTDLGIRLVPKQMTEAGRALGGTHWQILLTIRLPQALPSIMQGINQTIVMAFAMVVIASMIGARGLGEDVLEALSANRAGDGLVAGLAILILAVVFDRITQAFGRRLQAHRH